MSTLSPHAKAITQALVAIALTAITAYRVSVTGKLTVIDALPVAVAVLAAIQVHLVPNLGLSWAKALISGASAVVGAVATFAASDPSDMTFAKIAVVAGGSFLVWWVPEFQPEIAQIEDSIGKHAVTVNLTANAAPAVASLAAAIPQQPVASTTLVDDGGPVTQPLPAVPAQAVPTA